MNARATDNADGNRKMRRCSDCNAIPQNGAYRHARGCPLFHELDAMNRDDAAWFAANPGQIRERALTAAERAEYVMLKGHEPSTDRVAVAAYGDKRLRLFQGLPSAAPKGYETELAGPLDEALRRTVSSKRHLIEEFRDGDKAALVLAAEGDDHACALCAGVFPEPVGEFDVPCQVSADDERTIHVVLGVCAGCMADLASRSGAVQ